MKNRKVMSKYPLNSLILISLLFVCSCREPPKIPWEYVSVYALAANNHKFNGSVISTSGFLQKDPVEGFWGVYLHEDFAEMSLVKSCIYVENHKGIELDYFKGKYVNITGKFLTNRDFDTSINFLGKIQLSSIHDGHTFKSEAEEKKL